MSGKWSCFVAMYFFTLYLKNKYISTFFLTYLILVALGLHCCVQVSLAAGLLSGCGARASHCSGFSRCGAQAPESRLSSCGLWTQLLRDMWDLSSLGIEPVSSASAGDSFFFFFN